MKKKYIFTIIALVFSLILIYSFKGVDEITKNEKKFTRKDLENNIISLDKIDIVDEEDFLMQVRNKTKREVVYKGMTKDELANKLNKSLRSTLKGYGNVFAEKAMEYEVDPYIALAIILHETGCNNRAKGCSGLTRYCNNIGGMKGRPGCNGTSYRHFPTLEAGIDGFFKNLSKNYFKKGLTTPEAINKKYAENPNWYKTVNHYIKKIASK